MRKLRTYLASSICFALALFGSAALRGQAKRAVTAEDYLSFKFIGDPHISPDGKFVAYVLTSIDQKKNRRESSVWLIPADGSAGPRRLSAEGFSSNSPRWSPDGKVWPFFLRARRILRQRKHRSRKSIFFLSVAAAKPWL